MKNVYKPVLNYCLKVIPVFLLSFPLISNAQESMRANLYVMDASGPILVDGNLTNYSSIYSNAVDINDGWKMTNPGFNFGILREGYDLIVERRNTIGMSDTTFFRMWNLPRYNYQIKFMLSNLNHPGLKGVLKDNYMHTETPIGLNDTTYYNFKVDTNAASFSQDRFQLIYKPASAASGEVNFTGIKAQRDQKDVAIEWSVSNEFFMGSYIIEHSADGNNFQEIYEFIPGNNPASKTYHYTDTAVADGDNYYRVKVTTMGGLVKYSEIARAKPLSTIPNIAVYPNPVMNKKVQFELKNLPAGKYSIVLQVNDGNSIPLSSFVYTAGQNNYSVNLPHHLLPGVYKLVFVGPDKTRVTKLIVVL